MRIMENMALSSKVVIPLGRIQTIMKSTSDEVVTRDSSIIMSKAAELFIRTFTQECYNETKFGKKIDYRHLSTVVHNAEKYGFLRDILPKKITVLEFREIMEQKNAAELRSAEDNSSSDDESSSTEDTSSERSSE